MVVRRLAKAKIAGSIPVSRFFLWSGSPEFISTSAFYFALNFGDKWGHFGDNVVFCCFEAIDEIIDTLECYE